jgi:hypothetical protein
MRHPYILPALGLLLAAVAVQAQSPFVFGPEEVTPKSVKPGAKWSEGDVALPAWPEYRDLIPIALDQPGSSGFSYFIDQASLDTGEDGVVRYTLVAESRSGHRNISFEGIRCTPRGDFRLYAYGQNNDFEPIVDSQWQRIDQGGSHPVRHELWRHYLCVPRLFAPRPTRDQLRMLQSGRVPEIENSGFLAN